MSIQPRIYQTKCVEAIYGYFNEKCGNPVCALPTGTGKSVIIAMLLRSIFEHYPNQRIIIATHVKELIGQNYRKLIELWPTAPAGIHSAGLKKRDTWHNIIFGGIASMVKRWKEFGKVNLLLIDEAHLVSPDQETMYQAFINALKSVNPDLKVIGFTATPWRLGQGKITDDGIFTDICFDMTYLEAFNWLIENKFLVPLIPKRMKTEIDTDNLHIRAGEFIQSELQHLVDKDSITKAALREALEYGENRHHWLIFATGIEHAEHIKEELERLNVSCGIVHSKMAEGLRDSTIADFLAGKLRAVVNVGVLTTGFDFPAIDLIVMLRPTASVVLWIQMLGRGTRPDEGKTDCMVLDFAGNTRRLGPINDPVIPRKKGEKGGEAPVKECEVCNTYCHARVPVCPCCGHKFTFKVKIQQNASTAPIIRGNTPVKEVFKVDHITYVEHHKQGAPVSMKVSYFCGLRMFQEWVCLEHVGGARGLAIKWWKERSYDPCPETVKEGIAQSSAIAQPTHILVWTNTKYPEILSYCYDGSAFGKDTEKITVSA